MALGTLRQQYLFMICSIAPILCILMNFVLVKATGEVANIFAVRYFQYLYPLLFIAAAFIIALAFEYIQFKRLQCAVIILGIALFLAVQSYNLSYKNPMHAGIKSKVAWVIENAENIGDNALVILPYYAWDRGEVIKRIYFESKYQGGDIEPFSFHGINEEIIVALSKPTIVTFGSISNESEEIFNKYYSIELIDASREATIWRLKED